MPLDTHIYPWRDGIWRNRPDPSWRKGDKCIHPPTLYPWPDGTYRADDWVPKGMVPSYEELQPLYEYLQETDNRAEDKLDEQ